MALIMVLSAITILTVMLTEFQEQASAEFGSALSERDSLRAEYAARSAINLSRLLIAAEPTMRSAIPIMGNTQIAVWDYAPEILGAFNDEVGREAFTGLTGLDLSDGKNLGFDGASFEVEVVDEESKINVNTPARGSIFYNARLASQIAALIGPLRYDPLFEQRGSDGNYNDRSAVCSALIDWTDPDQEVWSCGLEGGQAQQQAAAEDSFYQFLDPPYQRKNAAYDSLQELHLVRGVNDVFWANFVEPEVDRPRKRLLTVWGGDKININNASALSIWALVCSQHGQPNHPVCVDPEKAKTLFIVFDMIQGFARGMPLFMGGPSALLKTLEGKGALGPMLQGFGLEPMQMTAPAELEKMMGTESKVFSIYAKGKVRSGKRETTTRIHAVVDFRSAPPPGQARRLDDVVSALGADGDAVAGALGVPRQAPDEANLPAEFEEGGVAAFVRPSPGGEIIYYRIN